MATKLIRLSDESPTKPWQLTHPAFRYRRADETNIRITFERERRRLEAEKRKTTGDSRDVPF